MKNDAINFLEKSFELLRTHNISLHHWEIDHLCYRTSSKEHYQQTISRFQDLAICLTETLVNGRPITTFKLHEPLRFQHYVIDLIEVPAPKPDVKTIEGFEHFEVVVDCDLEVLANQFRKQNSKLSPVIKKKQTLNSELVINIDDLNIKFHHKSLEQIINIEKNNYVQGFIKESHLFVKYSPFCPCIAGTIPIGLTIKRSDLDILLSAEQLDQIEEQLTIDFAHYPQFKMVKTKETNTLSCSFYYQELRIEFFAEKKLSYKQRANIHMLVEGRIIKLLGPQFKDKIMYLREQGLKTEPAFGKILQLKEPYEELLELYQLSDQELLKRLYHLA